MTIPGNMFPRCFLFAAALWMAVEGALLAAEDRVEVAAVQFATVRTPEGNDGAWLEVAVELEARPAAERSGRVTAPLRVEALLAHEMPATAGEARRWVFYRSAAELVGLTAGRAQVRFYLPPVLLQRDRLTGSPRFWEIVLTGPELAPLVSERRIAPALTDAAVRRAFREKIAFEAPANDGILLPQYLTPFANDARRVAPAFIRRAGW
jgi:hypothetical protein